MTYEENKEYENRMYAHGWKVIGAIITCIFLCILGLFIFFPPNELTEKENMDVTMISMGLVFLCPIICIGYILSFVEWSMDRYFNKRYVNQKYDNPPSSEGRIAKWFKRFDVG